MQFVAVPGEPPGLAPDRAELLRAQATGRAVVRRLVPPQRAGEVQVLDVPELPGAVVRNRGVRPELLHCAVVGEVTGDLEESDPRVLLGVPLDLCGTPATDLGEVPVDPAELLPVPTQLQHPASDPAADEVGIGPHRFISGAGRLPRQALQVLQPGPQLLGR